jgi:rSAM/selenodomain-associated transferase 2
MSDTAISVVIPAFDEASIINDAVRYLQSIGVCISMEIIVVDGSADGKTIKAVKDPRVKKIISERGRCTQMNAGAHAARGEIILFLHVDTQLPADAFEKIDRAMKDDRFVGGAFDLGIADELFAFRIIERCASLRSRLTRVPYGDQAIFFRRDYFHSLGSYRELPVMEDVDLMRRVKRKGGRICFIRKKVKTSSRRWRQEGVVACTLRNRAIMLLYLLGVSPDKLAKWYRVMP